MTKCNRCGRSLTKGKDMYVKMKLYDPNETDKKTFCMACMVSKTMVLAGHVLIEEEDLIDDLVQKEYEKELLN